MVIPEIDVEALEDRIFRPTKLKIYVGDKFEKDGQKFVNVATELKQFFENGHTLQYAEHVMPFSVLAIITGYDPETGNPTVNKVALNQLLQSFKLNAT